MQRTLTTANATYVLTRRGDVPNDPAASTHALSTESAVRRARELVQNATNRARIARSLRISVDLDATELLSRFEEALRSRRLVLWRRFVLSVGPAGWEEGHVRPTMQTQAEGRTNVREHEHATQPRPSPIAEPEPTWFEVRLVDELGVPLEGVRCHVSADRKTTPVLTDGDGRARVDSYHGDRTCTATIPDPKALQDVLAERWTSIREGERIEAAEDHTFLSCRPATPNRPLNEDADFIARELARPRLDVRIGKEKLQTLVFQPDVVLARFVGRCFHENKAFPLPNPHLGELARICAGNPSGHLLVVGHTDTPGKPEDDGALALERANAVVAMLQRDVEAWLRSYATAMPEARRWGTAEDALMLDAILRHGGESATNDRVRHFQRTRGLTVDGIIGPQTRRALVTECMDLHGVTLPGTVTLVAHGREDETHDHRVEFFFFRDGLGILPPPPGLTSSAESREYPEWRRRVVEEHTFHVRRSTAALVFTVDRFELDHETLLPGFDVDAEDAKRGTTGIGGLVQVLAFVKDNPDRHLLVVGHTDASGSQRHNLRLSERRAENVHAFLAADADAWLRTCKAAADLVDWKHVMVWAARRFGWNCDPGGTTDVYDARTKSAVQQFRTHAAARLGDPEPQDGPPRGDDWALAYRLYELVVSDELGLTVDELTELRQGIAWTEPQWFGAGELWPRGQSADRRVEVIAFASEVDVPRLPSDPPGRSLFTKDATIELEYLPPVVRTIFDVEAASTMPAAVPRAAIGLTLEDDRHRACMTDSNGVARAYDLPVAAFELECRTPDDVDAKVRARHVDIALQAGDLDAVLGILGQSRGSVRIVATAYAELVADGDPEAMATNIRAVAAGTPRASKAELVLVHAGFDSSWSFFQSEAKAS